MSTEKKIGIAQVLQHLKNGLTREEIAAHYGIDMTECRALFKHPELLGKKTHKKPSFVIVEDEETEVVNMTEAPGEVVEYTSEGVADVATEDSDAPTPYSTTVSDEVEEEEEFVPGAAKPTWED
jgi:hypothetical protein